MIYMSRQYFLFAFSHRVCYNILIHQTKINMTINSKNKKEELRSLLLHNRSLPKNTRAIVLSFIQNPEILEFFRVACDAIWVVFISDIDDKAISGSDIWITDTIDDGIPIEILCNNHVIPVVPAEIHYKKVFTEFDPMKFEWNAFIFEAKNQFQMFEKLIRAIENMRYAGDKRTLLQNVEAIKITI